MNTSIKEFYAGKNVLLTGCTGFVGKVVLEKFIRSLPEVNKFYILVRHKAGVLPIDRIKREIFQSECFKEVKKIIPNLEKFIEDKVVPVEGDISVKGMAMKPEVRKIITDNVHIIFNIAASVDFNEPLIDAININFRGCLQMLKLAQDCKHLLVHTHVSTCYVNSDKRGFIQEKIYQMTSDPEELIESLSRKTPNEIKENLANILGEFPNTYTFTKSMAERVLQKKRGDLPVVLFRPSIIANSLNEPMPGWGDTLAAAGGLVTVFGAGILNYAYGGGPLIGDIVPVDFVSNGMIVAAAKHAMKNDLMVVHLASSDLNPMTWDQFQNSIKTAVNQQPFDIQQFKPDFMFIQNEHVLHTANYFRNTLPVKVMKFIGKLTLNQDLQKNATRLQVVYERVDKLRTMFKHFTSNSWIYESRSIKYLKKHMTEQDLKEFQFDPSTYDNDKYIQLYICGLQKYIYKQNVTISPAQETHSVIRKGHIEYFEDIKETWNKGYFIQKRDTESFKTAILNSGDIQRIINSLVSEKTPRDVLEKQAKQILNGISANFKRKQVQTVYYVSHKIFRRIYDQIIINEKQMQKLKNLINRSKQPVMLLPSFKSFMDCVLLSYAFYYYGIELPFMCAAEDELNASQQTKMILRQCGAYFLNTKQAQTNPLYSAIFEQYIVVLGQSLFPQAMFIEKSRGKLGKILQPDGVAFNYVVKNVSEGKLPDNITFVPITISYERIFEGETFPRVLLGEDKEQVSFFRTMSQSLDKSGFGRVYINICQDFQFKDYLNDYASTLKKQPMMVLKDKTEREFFQDKLQVHICQTLQANVVVTITSLIASILLMHRRGTTQDVILKETQWLYEELAARNALMGINGPPSQTTVETALSFLSHFIDKKRNIFEPQVSSNKKITSVMMLAYYRNGLTHCFLKEAFIVVSLLGFRNYKDGAVSVEEVREKCNFLRLMKNEFMIDDQLRTDQSFNTTLAFLQQRGFVQYSSDQKLHLATSKTANFMHSFLYNLFVPFLDSYWLTFCFVIHISQTQEEIGRNSMEEKVQWLGDSFFEDGLLPFYEACSLESIKNAINEFARRDILIVNQKQKTKNGPLETIKVNTEKFDEDQLAVIYENLIFYKPFSPSTQLTKIKTMLRQLLSTDIIPIAGL